MINLNGNDDIKNTQEFKALIVENHKNLIAQILVEAFNAEGVEYLESDGFNFWCGLADFNQATIGKAITANNGAVNNTRFITETLCPPSPKNLELAVSGIDIKEFLNQLDGPEMDEMSEVEEFENDLDWSDPV